MLADGEGRRAKASVPLVWDIKVGTWEAYSGKLYVEYGLVTLTLR